MEKPVHYKEGFDSFAWAERRYSTKECLAIAAFNINKYNDRDKGQDFEDFGKIVAYVEWAKKLMTKGNTNE